MDPHEPANERFVITCDGTPYTPDGSIEWQDPQTLAIARGGIFPRPSIVTLSYDGLDQLFKSTIGETVALFINFPIAEA